jgi:hypothetical protein
VRLWHVLVVLLFFGLVNSVLTTFLGLWYGLVATVALAMAIIQVFRNASNAPAFPNLDTLLMRTPALGPIYERWFRRLTYYRHDTRLIYLELIPSLVTEIAEHLLGAKGIRLERQYRWGPVLGELYKPVEPRIKRKEP